MTISSGFFEVLSAIVNAHNSRAEEHQSLHCSQPCWGPDMVENVAESFLGHSVCFERR